jgi:hypothetical protein
MIYFTIFSRIIATHTNLQLRMDAGLAGKIGPLRGFSVRSFGHGTNNSILSGSEM